MLLFIARGQKSGAGQEAARWFLSVGAASGTVAETICVYVKDVSDQIYGAPERATCRRTGLSPCSTGSISSCNRLSPARAKATRFFVFADTVAARDCSGASQHHGWLGIRFQAEPESDPSQMLLHINLRNSTAQLQQQATGILG